MKTKDLFCIFLPIGQILGLQVKKSQSYWQLIFHSIYVNKQNKFIFLHFYIFNIWLIIPNAQIWI